MRLTRTFCLMMMVSHSTRGLKRKSTVAMLSAIFVMWLLTTSYWISCLFSLERVFQDLHGLTTTSRDHVANMQACLKSLSAPIASSRGAKDSPCHLGLLHSRQSPSGTSFAAMVYEARACTGTVALTVNVSQSNPPERTRDCANCELFM